MGQLDQQNATINRSALPRQIGSNRLGANRNGAMVVMIVIVLLIMFVASAFAIDIAFMHATRAELRTATDAAARAGSEALGRLQDTEAAIDAAQKIAAQNQVAGRPLLLDRSDVLFGSHQQLPSGKFQFISGAVPVTSIRIVGRRTAKSPSGSVPLFFGPLLGVTEFEPIQQATASRLDRDIALVLDVSGSMRHFGRFDALKNALSVFVSELDNLPQEEFVSLSVYNQNAQKLVDMTNDLPSIQEAFDRESPGGYTAIGRGLNMGLDSFEDDVDSRPFAFKELILMTDGNHNTGVNPLDVVRRADSIGVVVHTITFGSGANQPLMRSVAQAAHGTHLHADTNRQLINVFREIAVQIPVILID